MNSRIRPVRKLLAKKGLEAFLVTNPKNVFYLTNIQSLNPNHREVIVLVTKKKTYLFASPLLSLQNTLHPKKLPQKLGQYRRVGFESTDLTHSEYIKLKKSTTLVATNNLLEDFRQIKNSSEISAIYTACKITSTTMNWIKNQLQSGITEKILAWMVEKHLREQGADSLAFPVIVASGPNSAVPHHASSNRTIKTNDVVLLDLGCKVNGYCSDMTRTFFMGKPTHLQLKVETAVKQAYQAALSTLTTNHYPLTTDRVDSSARQVIESANFGPYFIHSTGHNLGLDIHESPSLSSSSSLNPASPAGRPKPCTLLANMVFTIEPGIYIPNKFGYRYEDTVLLTKNGPKVLTT